MKLEQIGRGETLLSVQKAELPELLNAIALARTGAFTTLPLQFDSAVFRPNAKRSVETSRVCFKLSGGEEDYPSLSRTNELVEFVLPLDDADSFVQDISIADAGKNNWSGEIGNTIIGNNKRFTMLYFRLTD